MKRKKKLAVAGFVVLAGFGVTVPVFTPGDVFADNEVTSCTTIGDESGVTTIRNLSDFYNVFGGETCVEKNESTNTIKLKKDIIVNSYIYIDAGDENREYDLDLNGHYIRNFDAYTVYALIGIARNNKLTVSGDGGINFSLDDDAGSIFALYRGGELVINSGNYHSAHHIVNGSTAFLEGKSKVKITNGNFYSGDYSIIGYPMDIEISGGDFKSRRDVLWIGNNFNANPDKENKPYSTTTTISGNPVFCAGVDENGNVTNDRMKFAAIKYSDAPGTKGKSDFLRINGGTFEGSGGALMVWSVGSEGEKMLNGGSFKSYTESLPAISFVMDTKFHNPAPADITFDRLLANDTLEFKNASTPTTVNTSAYIDDESDLRTYKALFSADSNPITVGSKNQSSTGGEDDDNKLPDDEKTQPEDIVAGDETLAKDKDSDDSNDTSEILEKGKNPGTGDAMTALVPIMSGSMAAVAGAAIYIVKKRML